MWKSKTTLTSIDKAWIVLVLHYQMFFNLSLKREHVRIFCLFPEIIVGIQGIVGL